MQLSAVRSEIEHMRRQILRQRKETRDLQRAEYLPALRKSFWNGCRPKLTGRALSVTDNLGSSAENILARTRSSTGQPSGASIGKLDVRFAALNGLKSDIAALPKSARNGSRRS